MKVIKYILHNTKKFELVRKDEFELEHMEAIEGIVNQLNAEVNIEGKKFLSNQQTKKVLSLVGTLILLPTGILFLVGIGLLIGLLVRAGEQYRQYYSLDEKIRPPNCTKCTESILIGCILGGGLMLISFMVFIFVLFVMMLIYSFDDDIRIRKLYSIVEAYIANLQTQPFDIDIRIEEQNMEKKWNSIDEVVEKKEIKMKKTPTTKNQERLVLSFFPKTHDYL